MKYIVYLTVFFILFSNIVFGQNNLSVKNTKRTRILVSSGGGARGAWGVGVAEALMQKYNCRYKVVFGTSTGSLMAPFILLNKMTALETAYTSVTEDSIFSLKPFNVSLTNNTVTTTIKPVRAVWRLLFKKYKTVGETKNLHKLITRWFTRADFDTLRKQNLYLAVAVTNMKTGDIEIINSNAPKQALYKDGKVDEWQDMCNWIWASANEPLFMSYYSYISHDKKDTAYYVDGGVRDVVPIMQGINYAKKYARENNFDTVDVDVIINNGKVVIKRDWTTEGRWINGLLRILDVYDAGTVNKDIIMGSLYAKYHDLYSQTQSTLPDAKKDQEKESIIILHLYFMNQTLAESYSDELGFFQSKMKELLDNGKHYFDADKLEKNQPLNFHISSKSLD
jgi:NTE family protein